MKARLPPATAPLRAAALAAAAVLAGCAARAPAPSATDEFDEATGTTISRVAAPVIFFSEDPAFAANARDYLYAAPLAVSRSGQRSYWLWIGTWSSIDREVSVGRLAPAAMSALVLVADGEPMELDATAKVDAPPGGGGSPYATPVPGARQVFIPVTRSQLARFSAAREVAARTSGSDGVTRAWQPWVDAADGLAGFAELAAGGERR